MYVSNILVESSSQEYLYLTYEHVWEWSFFCFILFHAHEENESKEMCQNSRLWGDVSAYIDGKRNDFVYVSISNVYTK